MKNVSFKFTTDFDIDNEGLPVSVTEVTLVVDGVDHEVEIYIDAGNGLARVVECEGHDVGLSQVCRIIGDDNEDRLDELSRAFKAAAETHLDKEYAVNGSRPEWNCSFCFEHETIQISAGLGGPMEKIGDMIKRIGLEDSSGLRRALIDATADGDYERFNQMLPIDQEEFIALRTRIAQVIGRSIRKPGTN